MDFFIFSFGTIVYTLLTANFYLDQVQKLGIKQKDLII